MFNESTLQYKIKAMMIYIIAKEFQELIFEITITKINMALAVKNGKSGHLFF